MSTGRGLRTMTLLTLLISGAAAAGGFKYYPGSTRYTPADTEANRQWTSALRPGTTITAWFSSDTFEQVLGFYRAIGREYSPPHAAPSEKLPNGQQLRKTFLILDGAPDLMTSKEWISIQHPFVGSISRTQGAPPQYQDVRDVTEIVLTEKRPVPKQQKTQSK